MWHAMVLCDVREPSTTFVIVKTGRKYDIPWVVSFYHVFYIFLFGSTQIAVGLILTSMYEIILCATHVNDKTKIKKMSRLGQ